MRSSAYNSYLGGTGFIHSTQITSKLRWSNPFFEIEYDPVGSNRIGNRVLGLMFFKNIFHLWAF